MNKTLTACLALALILPLAASAADDAELRAQCEQYAVEDKIPAEDLEQFMKECMGETLPEIPPAEKAPVQE